MHFAVSGVDVFPFLPPLIAFVISFFTSTGGVSGAFLLLPFQMSVLHFTSPAVSATNQLFNIVAIPSGVWRYIKEGRMVWPLTWVVIGGTLPGVLIGAVVRVRYLPDPARFKLFAAGVLLYIGARLVKDLLAGRRGGSEGTSAEERFRSQVRGHRRAGEGLADAGGPAFPRVHVKKFTLSRITYEFHGEVFDFSTPGIFTLSFLVGIVGGVYGIGGGAILAPFFVTFFRLPVYTVAGATLMGTFITSVAGVGFYQAIAPFYPGLAVAPDYPLGLLFGLGGMAGMYCGARLQKHVPAKAIKGMLAAVIVFLAVRYVLEFLR
jgi:uncharacterized membrane protein YfcA